MASSIALTEVKLINGQKWAGELIVGETCDAFVVLKNAKANIDDSDNADNELLLVPEMSLLRSTIESMKTLEPKFGTGVIPPTSVPEESREPEVDYETFKEQMLKDDVVIEPAFNPQENFFDKLSNSFVRRNAVNSYAMRSNFTFKDCPKVPEHGLDVFEKLT